MAGAANRTLSGEACFWKIDQDYPPTFAGPSKPVLTLHS
jgi:hypothetical protein